MNQQHSHEAASLLHELDLGRHLLLLLSDGSMELCVHDGRTHICAENGTHLDEDETYRLFISLHNQFTQKGGGYARADR
ncbi:MAG: hypothetical protein ACR2H5_22480 [Ktedonobacteraceae bacterium]